MPFRTRRWSVIKKNLKTKRPNTYILLYDFCVGDPLQLGPVILSKIASSFGLEETYLERMLCRFPYIKDLAGFPETGGYDPRLVTKLIYNYRSLPDVLQLCSGIFYNKELKPTVSYSGGLLS